MSRQSGSVRGIRPMTLVAIAALLSGWPAVVPAATKTVDLDGQTTNGAESK